MSKKKYNRFFYLENMVTLYGNDGLVINSNVSKVISPINKYCSRDICDCDAPYWRI